MKIFKGDAILFYGIMLSAIGGFAQTVNTGKLSIESGTIVSSMQELHNEVSGDLINDGDLLLYSNYSNDGLVTFTPGITTGMTRMQSQSAVQNISGESPMQLNNVVFDNSHQAVPFHVSNEVSIAGQSYFESGIVDVINHQGLIVFEDDAVHFNANDSSYIEGEVRNNGNDSFQFPIGAGGHYRYLGMSAPDNATDAFSGIYHFENSNNLYPHNSKAGVINAINNAEYWIMDKKEGNTNIFITLTWDERTTPANIYAEPYEEIHIVRWDAGKKLWVDEGGAVNPETKEVTMIIDPLKDYGVFTLARVKVDNILPCGGKGVVIYNAISPNGDGINDYFNIDGIENCTNNQVQIFNRWGVKVFETRAYNTSGNTFKGISEGRATVKKGEVLPEGTYFYVIEFLDQVGGKNSQKAGYLYIKN